MVSVGLVDINRTITFRIQPPGRATPDLGRFGFVFLDEGRGVESFRCIVCRIFICTTAKIILPLRGRAFDSFVCGSMDALASLEPTRIFISEKRREIIINTTRIDFGLDIIG